MKHFTSSGLQSGDAYFKRHLINSLSGYKSANLIGTISPSGRSNLALFSSVVHVGASPPMLGMIMRPLTVPRQTYQYIKSSGFYTINHVHHDFIDKAHYTSAKFDENTSEFATCGLSEQYIDGFLAPYVKESKIKLGMILEDELPIKQNGTIFIIGRIEHIYVEESIIEEDGNIDLSGVGNVAISGLETYYKVERTAHFPFARVGQWPKSDLPT